MEVRDPAAPIGDLPAPGNISATEGDHDGEIDAHWNRVKGAKSYVTQRTTTPTDAASWGNPVISTKSKVSLTGLVTGTKYYLRVAAIGAAGQGAWSELASQVAP
ncbi:MAG: fibronectin type III domain-containing protein [Limisphaerales bacterium]